MYRFLLLLFCAAAALAADDDLASRMKSVIQAYSILEQNAADPIESALEKTIGQKRVTYDFERQMEGARVLKTSEFASAIIENL